jgi:hypothetical protein
MKHKCAAIIFVLVVPILLAVGSTGSADEPEVIEMESGQAKVTLIEGRAELLHKEPGLRRVLSRGDLLRHGDRVTTEDKTRIELGMPDGSFVRFDEKTTFELVSASYEEATRKRDIEVHSALGKT